jgi:cell division protein FtsQ
MIRKKRETTQVDLFDSESLKKKIASVRSGEVLAGNNQSDMNHKNEGNPILMGQSRDTSVTNAMISEESGELISFDQILNDRNGSDLSEKDQSDVLSELNHELPGDDSKPVIEEDTDDVIINKDFADGFYPGKKKSKTGQMEVTRRTALLRHRRQKRYLKLIVIGLLLLILITALNWNEWITQSSIFTLKTIDVQGCEIADRTDVIQWSGLEKGVRLGIIDAQAVSERIQKQPLFKQVVISKQYPSTIQIRVEERKPVAFIAMDELHAMDGDGFILPKLKTVRSYNLPVITGIRAALKTGSELKAPGIAGIRRFLNIAQSKNPAMYFDISEIEYRKDGLKIYLNQWPFPFLIDPETPESGLLYIEAASDYFKKNPNGKKIKEIDLRYDNKMIIRNK